MRRTALFLVFLLVVTAGQAAERKPYGDVSIDDLIAETQLSCESPDGINIYWYVPIEYWQVALAAEEDLAPEIRKQLFDALGEYMVLGVVRGDMTAFGTIRFHDRARVKSSISVNWAPEGGDLVPLSITEAKGSDAAEVLKMVGPMLSAAMGNLGENFHLFLIRDRDAEGNRVASPYERGVLRITATKLGTDSAGTIEFRSPFDALHIPRHCAACTKDMHITWNFCPWCGEKLPR